MGRGSTTLSQAACKRPAKQSSKHLANIYLGYIYIYIYCASVLPQPKSSLCATTGGQVVQKLVMDSDSADSRLPLGTIPNCSMKEFWLPLTAFDVSARSKHGCRVVENVVCLGGA